MNILGFVVGFVFFILMINAVALIIRIVRNRSLVNYGRRGVVAKSEAVVMERATRSAMRRIEAEQERYQRYIELRSKTWELYEEVRQKHEKTGE